MSADLFAEFNSLSDAPPPSSQPVLGKPTTAFKPAPYPSTEQQLTGHAQISGTTGTGQLAPTTPWPSAPTSGVGNAWTTLEPASAKANTDSDDDDGWGDFEVAQPTKAPEPKSVPFPVPAEDWTRPSLASTTEPPSRTRLVRASTFDLMSNNLIDVGGSSPIGKRPPSELISASARTKEVKAKEADPNVLFDVAEFELGDDDLEPEDNDDFDDFGDFESVAPRQFLPQKSEPTKASETSTFDLLSLGDTLPKAPPSWPNNTTANMNQVNHAANRYAQSSKASQSQQRRAFPALAIQPPVVAKPSQSTNSHSATPITAWPSGEEDVWEKHAKTAVAKKQEPAKVDEEWEAWDDFTSPDGAASGKSAAQKGANDPLDNWDWDTADAVQPSDNTIGNNAAAANVDDTLPPPINVPPPSILLSAFTDILSTSGAFLKPISKQNATIKQQVLSDPKTMDFLRGYVLLAATAGRIMAGRKQRWHRDKILAKSMSISAAGSKGMRLAGVDKTQSAREDREAADVLAIWRENVGRLRSAVAAVKATEKSGLRIPELSDQMQVHAAKMVPVAAKPCVICGLKREERVSKVDFEVEDSFGEWWVEHWGHRACKNFWIEHEGALRQR